eukprot:2429624-Heterocapsa_arctica.AAC.1
MGHEVQTFDDYEYCLGCGREATTKHSTPATINFWRRQYCKQVTIIERYSQTNHNIIFDGWWACNGCHARGP